ncbi:MAG TPA: ABC transporter permease [Thermomicrobiales bacterium]|nr:ABC transporter permease [Thermomicrobiales bacterium]
MTALLQSELFRIRRRAQSWIMIAISVGLVGLLYVGFLIAHLVKPDSINILNNLRVDNIFNNGLIVPQIVAPILAVVFGAGLIGSEYSWNTLRPLVARSRSRFSLQMAKWVTLGIYTLALTVLTIVSTFVFAMLGGIFSGQGAGVTGSTLIDIVAISARYSMALLPSAALAYALALIFRSNAVGIAGGIAITMLEPIIFLLLGVISGTFKSLEKGGMAFNITRLMSYGGSNDNSSATQVWTSAGILALWIVVLMVGTILLFRRRDITSG